jgi:thioesterase domain-containing protein/acyl-coenzyme A synthetase/AMP-(fatty) acid ligase/acyl carrier protein
VLVGLEVNEPQARLAMMVENSGVELVITGKKLSKRFASVGKQQVKLLCVEEHRAELEQESGEAFAASQAIDGESVACVLYRSGANGKPVGVQVRHRELSGTKFAGKLGIKESDHVAHRVRFSHDVSCMEVFRALAQGACVVNVGSRRALSPRKFASVLRDEGVTVLWTTAPVLERTAREFPWALKSVRHIVCEEEESVLKQLAEKLEAGVAERVYGVRGASEAGGAWLLYGLGEISETNCGVAVEHVAAGARLHVLDAELHPAAEGVRGEIYVGGETLSPGYEGKDQGEAVADSFITTAGARLYRTGIKAQRRRDGKLEFVSGGAEQITVSGYRMELGEIEAVLAEHPAVLEAAVVVRENDNGGSLNLSEALTAVVVAAEGQVVVEGELHGFLAERLREEMLPAMFVGVEEIARGVEGKVDRRAVERQVKKKIAAAAAPEYVAARTATEEQLAAIWAQTFAVERVGVQDNFFELGGHSLLATQVVARISDVFAVELPLRRLFEAPTVEQLARVVEQLLSAGDSEKTPPAWSPLVPIKPDGSNPPLFVPHAAGGQVFFYAELARRLHKEQPLYGLEARPSNKGLAPHTGLESMSAEYVEAIRTVQPIGPYLLGGWSLGGVIAFEMARQLKQQGQEVALLALIDSQAPSQNPETSTPETELVTFALHLGFTEGRIVAAGAKIQSRPLHEQLALVLAEAQALGLVSQKMTLEELKAIWDTFQGTMKVTERYAGGRYDGKITLYRAKTALGAGSTKAEADAENSRNDWAQWASAGVEVVTVPGNHFTMIREPQVKTLAKQLTVQIQKTLSTQS